MVEWYMKYWIVIGHMFKDELVGRNSATVPPKRQVGIIKLIKTLFIFSLLTSVSISKNIIWIEHRWNGKSVFGRYPPSLLSLAIMYENILIVSEMIPNIKAIEITVFCYNFLIKKYPPIIYRNEITNIIMCFIPNINNSSLPLL